MIKSIIINFSNIKGTKFYQSSFSNNRYFWVIKMDVDDNQEIKQNLKQAMSDLDKIKSPKKEKVRKDVNRALVNLNQIQIDQKEHQAEMKAEKMGANSRYYTIGRNSRDVSYTIVVIIIIIFVIIWLINS